MKAIFFDLYGTLLERPKNLYVYERLFAQLGLVDHKSAKNILLTQNLSSLKQTASLLAPMMFPIITSLEADLQEEVAAIRPYPESKEVLVRLREKGYALGIVSNLASPYRAPVHSHGLDALVDTLVFSCDEGMKKPQREIYLLACERLRVCPSEAQMVGDSIVCDHDGPIRAGLVARLLDRTGEREDSIASLHSLL